MTAAERAAPLVPGARPLLILMHAVHAVEGSFLDWATVAGDGFDLIAVEPRCEQGLAAPPPPLEPPGFGALRAAADAALARLAGLVEALPSRRAA